MLRAILVTAIAVLACFLASCRGGAHYVTAEAAPTFAVDDIQDGLDASDVPEDRLGAKPYLGRVWLGYEHERPNGTTWWTKAGLTAKHVAEVRVNVRVQIK